MCGEYKYGDQKCSSMADEGTADDVCLIDAFGTKEYNKDYDVEKCETEYAQYLRHSVEKIFDSSIELLNQRCNRELGKSTGDFM